MNNDENNELLIDYAEGNISAEKKLIVEVLLRHSPDARRQLEIIQRVFSDLPAVELDAEPAHYFSNFLPAVRSKIEQAHRRKYFSIPAWFPVLVKPVISAAIIFSIVGLYDMLKPKEALNEMYSIINEINQSPSADLSEDLSYFRIESAVNEVDSDSRTKILAKEIIASNTLYENVVSDRQILSELDDSQIEYILDQLPSVQ